MPCHTSPYVSKGLLCLVQLHSVRRLEGKQLEGGVKLHYFCIKNNDGISISASTGSYGRMRRHPWERAVRCVCGAGDGATAERERRGSPITESSPYEVRRAQELNNLLGPKGSSDAIDLICDLHNTTSNMGLTLIHYTSSDWVTLHICRYLQTKITKVPVRVLVLDVPISDAYSLESVSKHGFSIEVGPQPHGVVRADIYIIMKEAVDLTIDWIHKFNSGTVFEGGDMETFRLIKSVDYARDPETRSLTAAIHPQLQDKDFCLLKQGDPLFLSFSGETVNYEEEETLHPFFINEAAYYEKGIAFHVGKKMMLTIPTVQVQKD
ncbi:hypothetical protein G5714_000390 [Onychostoma macrolepis]|uniref:Uncharacterized protein n=1 Tax=Onychostoma macrolepis TaxID=369639 RepID=A0A7J6DGG3_9TELE|nr:hypothetical protein G5714_000390 [Onychostoma macrolepis]